MVAPQVVAKGADHIAQRIRELARENGVPLVDNKPLAQALYRAVESRPVMAAGMMTPECVGRGSI